MANNEQAFKEAEKELAKEKIDQIKNIMKSILQKMQDEREKKAKAEEALRILKFDMEDLRAGKIEKIQERHEKSKVAREASPALGDQLNTLVYYSNSSMEGMRTSLNWNDATSGTYTVSCSNGTIREFNL